MRFCQLLFLLCSFQVFLEPSKCISDSGKQEHERHKRQLVFPKPTLVQVSFCVATPLELKNYNIYVNNGFQLNFATPNTPDQLPNSFFFSAPTITARSIEKREIKKQEPRNFKPEPEMSIGDLATDQLYHLLGILLTSHGYNGTECLKHSICQLASIPLHRDDDLLHEILHFILTPSEHYENNDLSSFNSTMDDYFQAEMNGRFDKDCDSLYRFCGKSPLDDFTHIALENDEISNYIS